MTVFSILVGLGAGAVSALLFASAGTGTLIGIFVLFLLSPLPVAVAGLGWGWMVGSLAAVSAVVCLAVMGSVAGGIMHLLTIGLPTAVLSYLLLLSRETPGEAGGAYTQWYPVGRVLGFAAVWAGVLATLSLLTVASDYDGLRAVMRRNAELFLKLATQSTPGAGAPSNADMAAWAELLTISFAASVGMSWMLLSSLNLWLAGRVTRASARLTRPWPDLALVRVPPFAVLGFAGAIVVAVLMSLAGQRYLALIASGFGAAFLFVCMLVGLGILHYHSRQWALRPLALGATYASLMFIYPWSHLAAAMLAIAEPSLPVRRPPEDTPPPQPKPQDV